MMELFFACRLSLRAQSGVYGPYSDLSRQLNHIHNWREFFPIMQLQFCLKEILLGS